jgi:hypothetical protein
MDWATKYAKPAKVRARQSTIQNPESKIQNVGGWSLARERVGFVIFRALRGRYFST